MSIHDRVQETYMRQLDILNPLDIPRVNIIGCGASGTGIGIILTKLGVSNVSLWDGDKVDYHNIPNQYFKGNAIGQYKADALREEMERIAPTGFMPNIEVHNKMFEGEDRVNSEIVFMCADGLENRRHIMENLMKQNIVKWVIDTRMGGQYYEVWTINTHQPSEVDNYIESTFKEAREDPCTSRSVIYTVMMMSSRAVATFKKILKGQVVPLVYREDVDNDLYPVLVNYRSGESKKDRMVKVD